MTKRVLFTALISIAESFFINSMAVADEAEHRVEQWGGVTSTVSRADSTQGEVVVCSAYLSVKPGSGQKEARSFFLMVGWSKKHHRAVWECFPCPENERWIAERVRNSMAFCFDEIGGTSCVVRDRTLFVCCQSYSAESITSAWKTAVITLARAENADGWLSSQVKQGRLKTVSLRGLGKVGETFFPFDEFGGPWATALNAETMALGVERHRVQGHIKAITKSDPGLVIVFAGISEPDKKDELKVELNAEGRLHRVLLNNEEVKLSEETGSENKRW